MRTLAPGAVAVVAVGSDLHLEVHELLDQRLRNLEPPNLVAVDSGQPWCCGGGNAYLVTFDTQNDFTAAAGTKYWLQLTGANSDNSSSWWVTAPENGTSLGFNNGSQTGNQFAFFLASDAASGDPVPEPGTMAMAGLGVAAVLALRRRICARS